MAGKQLSQRAQGGPAARSNSPWPAPENRPLHTLFMAAAPEDGGAPLDFEVEEARMFKAAEIRGRRLMELTVEESGCLTDLRDLIALQPPGTFDLFHLTGHAGHDGTTPVFILEDAVGIGGSDPVKAGGRCVEFR